MYFKTGFYFFLFFVGALPSLKTEAQSLRSKVIYVSTTQEVMIKFRSVISDYHFQDKDRESSFERKLTNSKNLSINSTVENFKTTGLIVIEGGNTHLFVLKYKATLDPNRESLYDFSSKDKLRRAAETIESVPTEPAKEQPVDTVINQPEATTTTQPATATTGTQTTNTNTAEIKNGQKEIDDKYNDIVTKANLAYLNEKLEEAGQLYTAALAIRPTDPWCAYQMKAIATKKNAVKIKAEEVTSKLAYQKHIKVADSANSRKSYDLARYEYEQALREKPNDLYAQAQIRQIALAVKEDSYKSYMAIGKDAFNSGLFDDAEMAFKEALKIKPNDAEAKKELGKLGAGRAAFIRKQNEERMRLNEEQMRLKKQNQYDDTVSLADNMFEAGLYDEAKKKYIKASGLKAGDPYVANRLKEIEDIFLKRKTELSKIRTDSLNALAYKKEIDKGNNAFYNRDFTRAKSAFQMAQRLVPSEKFPAERISAIDIFLLQIEEEKKAEEARKALQESKNRQYNFAIRQGNAAMVNSKYEAAKDFFLQAKELKPGEKHPVSQLQIIYIKLAEIRDNEKYDNFIHLADSTAWVAGDLKSSLRWYDSARILKPLSSYPTKQIIAINQDLLTLDLAVSKQKRSEKFYNALGDFRKAESLRIDRKYPEAYTAYSEFLSKIDTLNLNEYMRSELYYINQAKDMLVRLERFQAKPKEENLTAPVTPAAPVETDPKKKKKKAKKGETADNPAAIINTVFPGNNVFIISGNNLNSHQA